MGVGGLLRALGRPATEALVRELAHGDDGQLRLPKRGVAEKKPFGLAHKRPDGERSVVVRKRTPPSSAAAGNSRSPPSPPWRRGSKIASEEKGSEQDAV